MPRKLTAWRQALAEPIRWIPMAAKPSFYKIDAEPAAQTNEGLMFPVRLRIQSFDIADPSVDLAALVGRVLRLRASGAVDPNVLEIWLWQDRFWLKARNSDGSPYYNRQQQFLLYEVQVADADGLLAQLTPPS